MGSFWAEIGKDRERKLRQERRTDAWLRKQFSIDERRSERQGVAQAKPTKAEQAGQAREDGLAEVEERAAALAAELAGLVDVLSAVVALDLRTLGWLRAHPPHVEFARPDPRPAGRRPGVGRCGPAFTGVGGRAGRGGGARPSGLRRSQGSLPVESAGRRGANPESRPGLAVRSLPPLTLACMVINVRRLIKTEL